MTITYQNVANELKKLDLTSLLWYYTSMKIYRQLKAKHNTFMVYRAKVWHGVNSLVNVLNMPNDHKFPICQCCSHHNLPLTRQPLSAMPSSYKSPQHTQPTPTATQTEHCSCTPQPLHIKLANHASDTQLQQTCSHPQHNPLSIHNNMHYTCSTAHSTAFHAQDNPSVHTSNKHKA